MGYIFLLATLVVSSFVQFLAFEGEAKKTLLLLTGRGESRLTFLEETEMAVSGRLWAP